MPFSYRRSSQVVPSSSEVEGSSNWLSPWRFSTGRSSSSGGSSARSSARSSRMASVRSHSITGTASQCSMRDPPQELGPYGRRGSVVPKVFVEEPPQEPGRRGSRISACSSTGGTGGGVLRMKSSEMERSGSLVEPGKSSSQAEAQAGAVLPSMCTCGEVFWEDSVYCRRCGQKRVTALELPAACMCGEEFTEDARFCHKCGRKRRVGKGWGGANRRMSMSLLEPRRKQMRMLAQEISDAQVVNIPSDKTICSRIFNVLRFVLTCQWIGGARRLMRAVADKDFIQTPVANSICGSVIILNAALIGFEMEVNNGDRGSRIAWFVVESVFLAFFIGELLLRFRSLGLRSMRDPVTLFDFLLIVLGVVDTWVAGAMVVSQSDTGSDALFKITLLRLVRLARMIRVLRVIKLFRYFRELVLLGRGIMAAVQALFWSGVLILMILYLCSVLTASGYIAMARGEGPSSDAEQDIAEWFGSIGSSLMTLFQVMTLEEWHVVVRTSNEMWSFSWMFFVPFILIANVALLNAVTAVVVENVWSIAQSEASYEAKRSEKVRAKALAKFKKLFQSIDVDHNAFLDQEEFKNSLNNPHVMQTLLDLGIARCEADELFELCDVDGNRVLSVAEFVDGCLRVIGPGKSKHLLQVQYDLLRAFRSLQGQVCELTKNLKVVVKALSKVHGVKMPRSLDLGAREPRAAGAEQPEEAGAGASGSASRKTLPAALGAASSPQGTTERRRAKSFVQANDLVRRISAPVVGAFRATVGRASSSGGSASTADTDASASSSGVPRPGASHPARLKISVLSATGLQKAGADSSPDAYCVCEVPCCSGTPFKFRTWAVRDGSPHWDYGEDVEDYAMGEPISFSVFSENAAGSGQSIAGKLLGKATLAGAQLLGDGFDGELKLREACTGCQAALRIRVELAAAPIRAEPAAAPPPPGSPTGLWSLGSGASFAGSEPAPPEAAGRRPSPEPAAAAAPREGAPRAPSPPQRPASPPADPAPPEAELKLLLLPAQTLPVPTCQSGCGCGSLLTTARQEQAKLNKIVEQLLEEAQLLHGNIAEVASLNWESPETRLSTGNRLLITQA